MQRGYVGRKNIIVNEFLTGTAQIAKSEMKEIVKDATYISQLDKFYTFWNFKFSILFILSIICNGLTHSGLIRYGIICNVGDRP